MGNYRVAAVHNSGIIPSFVEHSHLYSQNRSVVHIAVKSALVGAYHHKVLWRNVKLINLLKHCFKHLIRRHNIIKSHKRHRVAYSRIVSVKGNQIGYSHRLKLLKHYRTVQRLAVVSSMLSAAVKYGHYHAYSVGFSAHCLNNAL